MSVLIKGIDMPKDGGILCITIYPDGIVCLNRDLECKRIATAVPVPPHGRLIDADQFHKDNKDYWDRDFNYPQYEDTLADLVNAAPTVIPASEEGEVL